VRNLGADVPTSVDNQWGNVLKTLTLRVRKHFAASLGTYVAKRAVAHIRFGATDAPPIILCRGLLEGDS
jgi:hypothetical protein